MRKRNGLFSGFGKVFSFTFRHQTEGKGFRFATYIVPFLLCGLVVLIMSLVAYSNAKKNDQEPVNIQKLYVLDETPYNEFNGMVSFAIRETELKDVEFKSISNITVDDFMKENKGTLSEENGWGILSLSIETKHANFADDTLEDHDVLMVRLTLPEGSEVNKSTRGKILNLGTIAAKSATASASKITAEQYVVLSGSHMSQIIEAGKKEDNVILMLVRYVGPFVFTIVMYAMLLMYCMGMGKNLVVEKSSKLMEMLLTSISPVALVAGKVLAIICVALLQFAVWIASIVIGVFIGNIVAQGIDPTFSNPVTKLIDLLMEYGHVSFTPFQVILALLSLVFCFAVYCVFAAVIASTCAKAEEVAQKQGVLNIFIIAGYLLAIATSVSSLNSSEVSTMLLVTDIIPFSAAFRLPVDVLLGTIPNWIALLSLGLAMALTVVFAILAGKVYKAQVFLSGNSIVSNAKRALFGKKKAKETK
ncbi:MAG: ABC transporter permease [Lachnospiraceae bacterium]|nr:ABC transporter permease [Lachnospiraceae bacterium]